MNEDLFTFVDLEQVELTSHYVCNNCGGTGRSIEAVDHHDFCTDEHRAQTDRLNKEHAETMEEEMILERIRNFLEGQAYGVRIENDDGALRIIPVSVAEKRAKEYARLSECSAKELSLSAWECKADLWAEDWIVFFDQVEVLLMPSRPSSSAQLGSLTLEKISARIKQVKEAFPAC